MKILFGITKSNFGGAQRYVYDLAKETQKRGFDVGVLCGGNGLLVEKLKKENIYPQTLTYLVRDISVWDDFKSLFKILEILRKNKPDVFHINSSKMGLGAVAGRLAGIPRIIFTVHGAPYEEDRPFLAKKIIKFFTWLTYIFSDVVITLSKENFEKAKKMPLVKKKIVWIQNGISPIEFSDKSSAQEYLSSIAWKPIPTDKTWVGTISELTKNKGLSYSLRGMAQLSHKKWVFIIIGIGEEKKNLINLCEKLRITENVFFLRFVDNAPRYLKAFDIFTLTSVKEGQPYVLLEAGQAALPVIASSLSGGIKEIIEDGISGILIPPKNPQSIKGALEKLMVDEKTRQDLGNNLKQKVENNFSFEKMVDETLALYKTPVSPPKSQFKPKK